MTLTHLLVGLFFTGLALICQGLTVILLYEAIAYATHVVPTISGITAEELLHHARWEPVILLGVGVVVGALMTHFTHWLP